MHRKDMSPTDRASICRTQTENASTINQKTQETPRESPYPSLRLTPPKGFTGGCKSLSKRRATVKFPRGTGIVPPRHGTRTNRSPSRYVALYDLPTRREGSVTNRRRYLWFTR